MEVRDAIHKRASLVKDTRVPVRSFWALTLLAPLSKAVLKEIRGPRRDFDLIRVDVNNVVKALELLERVLRYANVFDLASILEFLHRRGCLGHIGRRRTMVVVQVDLVDGQSLERGIRSFEDEVTVALDTVVGGEAEFGGNEELLPRTGVGLEEGANRLLVQSELARAEVGVDVRGVDHLDALLDDLVQTGVHGFLRLGLSVKGSQAHRFGHGRYPAGSAFVIRPPGTICKAHRRNSPP